jgi:hypothetical protein
VASGETAFRPGCAFLLRRSRQLEESDGPAACPRSGPRTRALHPLQRDRHVRRDPSRRRTGSAPLRGLHLHVAEAAGPGVAARRRQPHPRSSPPTCDGPRCATSRKRSYRGHSPALFVGSREQRAEIRKTDRPQCASATACATTSASNSLPGRAEVSHHRGTGRPSLRMHVKEAEPHPDHERL